MEEEYFTNEYLEADKRIREIKTELSKLKSWQLKKRRSLTQELGHQDFALRYCLAQMLIFRREEGVYQRFIERAKKNRAIV